MDTVHKYLIMCSKLFVKKHVLLFVFLTGKMICFSQNPADYIVGVVRDSVTKEPIPFASVSYEYTTIGTISNEEGVFKIKRHSGADKLKFSSVGYTPCIRAVPNENTMEVFLDVKDNQLAKIVVRPKNEKYEKKNNPAVALVENIIRRREVNDFRTTPYYTVNRYERVILGIAGFHEGLQEKRIFRGMDFLFEGIDTSEVSQQPYLPVAVRENVSVIFYRNSPESKKKIIKGEKNIGLDQLFNDEGVAVVLDELFSDVQIYDNNMKLLLTRFVSPIASSGPSFYKYYIEDTVQINNLPYIVLNFTPFNEQDFGFDGTLYVCPNSFGIMKMELNIPYNSKINMLDKLKIIQEFEQQENGTWALWKDETIAEFTLVKGMQGLYAKRMTYYDNHKLEVADKTVFDYKQDVIRERNKSGVADTFWLASRIEPLNEKEEKTDNLFNNLNEYWGFRILFFVVKTLIDGYIPVGDPPPVEVGPFNTFITGNYLEGLRLGAGAQTTPWLFDQLFLSGKIAYGFRDKKVKYNAELEYSFNKKERSWNEYPRRSIILSYTFDTDTPGERYLKTSKDNVFVSWKRTTVDQMSYLRIAKVKGILELNQGLNFDIAAQRQEEIPAGKLEYILNDEEHTVVDNVITTDLKVLLRFAPGEKVYLNKNYRFSLTQHKPVFTLSHTIGIEGLLGGQYNYHKTEASYGQRYFLTPYGYIDFYMKAGKVWNKVPFPLLFMPAANLSYIIQSETFWLMNNMEFINDQYVSLDFMYNFNGWLLSRIPLLKKLKWREVVRFRTLYGHLTDKNDPAENPNDGYLFLLPRKDGYPTSFDMKNIPYMEVSVGFHNIFKFLQIEYVRRLNYLDYPNVDKWGIRLALGFYF
jgi:hypothetical protein